MSKEETNIFKGIAIILMFVHHLFMDNDVLDMMNVHSILPRNALLLVASTSKICVAIFVFISAYGITLSNRENLRLYLSKRIIKIIIPFIFIYLMAAFAAIVSGKWIEIYGIEWRSTIYYVFIDILGLANLFGTPTLNGTWWYMSFAIFLPVIIVCAVEVYNKIGSMGLIIVGVFVPACFGVADVDTYRWWSLTIVMGVIFAKCNLFERIKKSKRKYFIYIVSVIMMMPIAYLRQCIGGYWIFDTLLVLPIAFTTILISKIAILDKVLVELGINSFYMFLTHSFIHYYYLRDFIYSWKYASLIFIVLLISSYILSKCISFVYKKIKIENIETYLLKKIVAMERI